MRLKIRSIGWGGSPRVVIAATTLATIAISIGCLSAGYFIIFQNLFYIPIILACVHYGKRGFAFSVFTAGLYFCLVLVFTREVTIVWEAFVRVLIFILVAGVVAYLSIEHKGMDVVRVAAKNWQDTFDAISDAVWLLSPESRILRSNKAAQSMLGLRNEEIVGRYCYEVMHGMDRPHPECPVARMRESGHRESSEFFLGGRCLLVSVDPIFDSAGFLTGIVHVISDITERKRMEKELVQAKEAQFKAVIETIPSKVFLKDRNSAYLSCNESYANDLKIRPEDIVGRTDYDFFPTQIANKSRDDDKRVMESGKTESWEEEYHEIQDYLAGSRKSYINIIKAPLRDKAGNVTGLLGIFWDITDRVEVEQALQKNKELLFDMAAQIPGVVYQFYARMNGEKGLYYVSEGSERMFGLKSDPENFFESFIALMSTEDRGVFLRSIDDAVREVKEWKYEGVLRKPSGEKIWFSGNSIPFLGDNEIIFNGILLDITERKKAELEKKNVADLKASAEMKSRFASMVSHELRSPLAVAKEALDILSDGMIGSVNEEQKDVLRIAKGNIDRLGRLINNVLDFQKIEAGKMELDIQGNDLSEILREVHQSMSILSKRKGLDLRIELEEGLPKVRFDRDKIAQVLTNLISNSINNTEKGVVTLAAKMENGEVRISVRDTGIGIPAEDIPKLFQPFEQVDGNKARKKGGTGLGLAISKEIILAHHGKIWAESEVGRGSALQVTLPL